MYVSRTGHTGYRVLHCFVVSRVRFFVSFLGFFFFFFQGAACQKPARFGLGLFAIRGGEASAEGLAGGGRVSLFRRTSLKGRTCHHTAASCRCGIEPKNIFLQQRSLCKQRDGGRKLGGVDGGGRGGGWEGKRARGKRGGDLFSQDSSLGMRDVACHYVPLLQGLQW